VCPEDAGIAFYVLGYNNTHTFPPPKRDGETNDLNICATIRFFTKYVATKPKR